MVATTMRRSLLWGAAALASGLVFLAGCGVLFAALMLALAEVIGWPASLSIGGLLLAAVGCASIGLSLRLLHQRTERLAMDARDRSQAALAHAQLKGQPPMASLDRADVGTPPALTSPPHADLHGPRGARPDAGSAASGNTSDESWQDRVAEAAVKHPATIAGVAFATFSLLGPGRTLKLISRGALVAGLASSVVQKLDERSSR